MAGFRNFDFQKQCTNKILGEASKKLSNLHKLKLSSDTALASH